MTKVVDVIYDGEVFRPVEAVEIPTNSRMVVYLPESADAVASDDGGLQSFFEKYKGTIAGPEDWSEEHDHYIHGTPKRSESI